MLPVPQPAGQSEDEATGRALISAPLSATMIMEKFGSDLLETGASLAGVVKGLQESMDKSKDGDLSGMEEMLIGQAVALQTMFMHLARRAQLQQYQRNLETFMGLALKCQAQSRATIDSLVNLKHPRTTVIAKQANVNQGGQQQVNNGKGSGPHVTPIPSRQNGLLEVSDEQGEWMDTAAAPASARGDTAVETMGTVHRSKNRRR